MNGRIKIQLTGKRDEYVYFELDEIGCQFLIDELNALLNHKKQCVEYDPVHGIRLRDFDGGFPGVCHIPIYGMSDTIKPRIYQ